MVLGYIERFRNYNTHWSGACQRSFTCTMNIIRAVVPLPVVSNKAILATGLINKAELASVKDIVPILGLLLVLALDWPGNSMDGPFFYKLLHLPSVSTFWCTISILFL